MQNPLQTMVRLRLRSLQSSPVARTVAAGLLTAGMAAAQTPATGVFFEIFTDLAGSSVSNLTNSAIYPLGPSAEGFLADFECPTN